MRDDANARVAATDPTGESRSDANRGAAGGDHQHAAAFSNLNRLVVKIDPHDRVPAERLGLQLHLLDRDVTRSGELLLVCARPPADDVAYPGEEVHEDVGTQDCLALDQSQL